MVQKEAAVSLIYCKKWGVAVTIALSTLYCMHDALLDWMHDKNSTLYVYFVKKQC